MDYNVVTPVAAFLSGGLVVALINNLFTGNRESKARRNEFRGFLNAWLNGIEREQNLWKCYGPDNLEHFCRYSGKLDADFRRRRKFRAMCKDLRGIRETEIENDQEAYRKIIAAKIEKLIKFV
jgi:hypothetical protein